VASLEIKAVFFFPVGEAVAGASSFSSYIFSKFSLKTIELATVKSCEINDGGKLSLLERYLTLT